MSAEQESKGFLQQGVDKVKELAYETKEGIQHAAEWTKEAAQHAGESMKEGMHNVSQKAHEMKDNIDHSFTTEVTTAPPVVERVNDDGTIQ